MGSRSHLDTPNYFPPLTAKQPTPRIANAVPRTNASRTHLANTIMVFLVPEITALDHAIAGDAIIVPTNSTCNIYQR